MFFIISAVSDVQVRAFVRVSELASVNVVRQRGLRAERQRGKGAASRCKKKMQGIMPCLS
ncbi:hypothetical protein [Ruminococcus flavefaciens]|uniref:hypothetical protein n=1 Tax=Ruminococcus flavefaciens TaxID=1265 RepID=UPI0004640466|nr:hypothetical protein [Ruminococcus flavefaciens]